LKKICCVDGQKDHIVTYNRMQIIKEDTSNLKEKAAGSSEIIM
jgi:hypothetical protein